MRCHLRKLIPLVLLLAAVACASDAPLFVP